MTDRDLQALAQPRSRELFLLLTVANAALSYRTLVKRAGRMEQQTEAGRILDVALRDYFQPDDQA